MARCMSKRNREKFSHEGHLYQFEAMDYTKTVKFWRCDKRDSDGCKARLHTWTETGEVKKKVNEHTHGCDPAGVEVGAVVTAIRQRADETMETPANILNEVYQGLPDA
uniref:FLYWCH-type domain-containing protein n=1 Tax=Trichuris muris TaxID=70415 RepID=A0A5S6PYY0_TRIMR